MSNNPVEKTTFLQRVLQRTGGWYPTIAVFVTQIFASLGVVAADYSIQVNAEFSRHELTSLLRISSVAILATNTLLILFVYLAYKEIRTGLGLWKKIGTTAPSIL